MKTTEDIYCSPELSKKLRELGVKYDSSFWWNKPYHWSKTYELSTKKTGLSAYLACEIADILPDVVYENELSKDSGIYCSLVLRYPEDEKDTYMAAYVNNNTYDPYDLYSKCGKSEVEALANLLIHLLEKKIIQL